MMRTEGQLLTDIDAGGTTETIGGKRISADSDYDDARRRAGFQISSLVYGSWSVGNSGGTNSGK